MGKAEAETALDFCLAVISVRSSCLLHVVDHDGGIIQYKNRRNFFKLRSCLMAAAKLGRCCTSTSFDIYLHHSHSMTNDYRDSRGVRVMETTIEYRLISRKVA